MFGIDSTVLAFVVLAGFSAGWALFHHVLPKARTFSPSDIAAAKQAVVKLAKKFFMDALPRLNKPLRTPTRLTAWMMQGLCQTMRSPEFVYYAHN